MCAQDYQLSEPPTVDRRRELWLQHVAGFILFENVRKYALNEIDPKASVDARDAAEKAIDDAMYGLMMLVDGVTGGPRNANHVVELRFVARLLRDDRKSDAIVHEIDLRDSDGFCMGFHGWKEGDFGDEPIVVSES
jgi:hypothetical protein